jgi:hypothetical protein
MAGSAEERAMMLTVWGMSHVLEVTTDEMLSNGENRTVARGEASW